MSYFAKSLALGLILISSAQPAQAGWWGKKHQPDDITPATIAEFSKTAPTPDNTVLVFDNHGVLTRFSKRAAISAAWNLFRNGGGPEDIWHRVANCFRKNKQEKADGNFFHFCDRVKRYFYDEEGNDQTFEAFALKERGSNLNYRKQAIRILNPHVSKPDTVELIKRLKQQGYNIFGCSNIGFDSLVHMQNELPDTFADISAWRTANPQTGFRKKKDPQAHAFGETKDLIAKKLGKDVGSMKVVMVDDKRENLEQAKEQANFYGILLNKKDPNLLRESLAKAKILK